MMNTEGNETGYRSTPSVVAVLSLIRGHGEVAARRTRLGIRFIMFPDRQLLKRLFSECVSHSFGYPLKHNPLQIL